MSRSILKLDNDGEDMVGTFRSVPVIGTRLRLIIMSPVPHTSSMSTLNLYKRLHMTICTVLDKLKIFPPRFRESLAVLILSCIPKTQFIPRVGPAIKVWFCVILLDHSSEGGCFSISGVLSWTCFFFFF